MPRAKKVAAAEPEAPKEPEKTVASVHTNTGAHVRTYTHEIHGDGFEDLAKQMAAQHEGSTIKVR